MAPKLKKRWPFWLIFLIYFLISSWLKKLPVIGGFLGFIELLAWLLFIGSILYYIGLHIYLWFSIRRDD